MTLACANLVAGGGDQSAIVCMQVYTIKVNKFLREKTQKQWAPLEGEDLKSNAFPRGGQDPGEDFVLTFRTAQKECAKTARYYPRFRPCAGNNHQLFWRGWKK